MDEKSMIIEQERQAKAKKRKKYKKIKWTAGFLAVVLAGGSIWYVSQGRYLLAASQTASVEIVAEDNQEIVYAYIEKINGNEITYRITEEPVAIQMNTENTGTSGDRSQMPDFGSGEMPEGMSAGGERPNMGGSESSESGEMPNFANGEMPEGMDFGNGEMPDFANGEMPEGMDFGNGEMPDFANGEMPEGMNFGNGEMPNFANGEMPGGMNSGNGEMPNFTNGEIPEGMPSGGERPGMGESGQNSESSVTQNGEDTGSAGDTLREPASENPGEPVGGFAGNQNEAETTDTVMSEATYTQYIPVGTEVTTKLGTVTTFSRLAAGDTVALVIEKDGDEQIIVAVYIVG